MSCKWSTGRNYRSRTYSMELLPQDWLSCPRPPKTVLAVDGINNKFYAFKTPLDTKYDSKVPVEKRFHPHTMLDYAEAKGCPIDLWIDLTNTSRYYDKELVEDQRCQYFKIKCTGLTGPPSPEDVQEFISTCSTFVDNNPNSHIGVHCTHGHNRTGFMIVSYLVTAHKYPVDKAISVFSISRPPGVYKKDYILELYKRYGGIGDPPPTPPLPEWHTQSDDAQDHVGLAADGQTKGEFKRVTEVAASRVREEIKRLCGLLHFSKDRFPVCQPVSMDRTNINKIKNDDYMVSEKADGKRFLMYIAREKEIYLIDRNNDVFQIDDLRFPSAQSDHLVETLVDGELVTYKNDGKQHFLIYDLISLNGDKVRLADFDIRYETIQKQIIEPRRSIVLSEEPIGIKRKEFHPVKLSTITELLSDKFKNECPYELDGLIFQPIKYWYRSRTCDNILKWKPASQNSIDYKLKITSEDHPEMPRCKIGELVVGPGKYRGEYRDEHVFATMAVTEDRTMLDGKVIECVYQINNDNSGKWTFKRVRIDKPHPNGYATAGAVWESIRNPVTEDNLKKFVSDLEKRTSEVAARGPLSRKGEQAQKYSQRSVKPLPHSYKR